ncbi:MAG: glycosyltransferase [Phycisphaerae bacterium]
MRIGVNAVPLRVGGGGARYVFTELMQRLLALDDENHYLIFVHPLGLPVVQQIARVHEHLSFDTSAARRVRLIETAREEEIYAHRDEFDLLFGPLNNLQPRLYDRPTVAILHDIQEQYFPEYFQPRDLAARREIYPEICRAATTLVTISHYCKQSIVEKFGIEPEKIEVVHSAPQAALVQRGPDDPGVWERAALPAQYLYYPAMRYPHKNHTLLLDALTELRRRGRRALGAVFTGHAWPAGGVDLEREIARRGLADACCVYDEVSVDELRYLYRHAAATVMPTRFEGFGLPAVEALLCGCPLVSSDLPAIRELVGDHALYFDPTRLDELVAALERVLDDESLRARLVEGASELFRRFNWDTAARQYLEIFRVALTRFCGFHPANPNGVGRLLPRIGVLISAPHGARGVQAALKSVWASGYQNVAVMVRLGGEEDAELRAYLEGAGVALQRTRTGTLATWDDLSAFAETNGCHLVGELHAGVARLAPTALHSLAATHLRDGARPLYVGEVWEMRGDDVHGVARLRLLPDGLWKLEGYLYPEMMYFQPRHVSAWGEAAAAIRAAGADWRWALLKAAHRTQRATVVRRTLALCETGAVGLAARVRAVHAGVESVYSANGEALKGGWLSRLKPVLKPASRLLPAGVRAKGTRLWRHLTHP